MKKIYLLALTLMFAVSASSQVRYIDKVFTDVTVTSDVTYGNNFTVITGSPMAVDLKMDIYQPTGDTETERPLIIFCHTGSYLPRYVNNLPTGDKTDSATVEFAKEFAKRGYVVANIAYRQGWNPFGDQNTRTSTILQAVYRSIHDAKTAARYFAQDVANNGNTYKVDTTKIAIGGNGTGGYVAINTVSLTKSSELLIDKFINFDSMPPQPYVAEQVFGNIDGFGGLPNLNKDNWKGHTSDFDFAFTIGGALGDSSWIEAGETPVVCVHGEQDPFAPYNTGIVFVPGTTTSVVEVSGGADIMKKVDALGNNAAYKGKVGGNLSVVLNARDGIDGLYTIKGLLDASGPWEWYDTNFIKANIPNGATIVTNGLASNPNMSKAKAMPYIDTICQYIAPRMAISMGYADDYRLSTDELTVNQLKVYPNPAGSEIVIESESIAKFIKIYDINGKELISVQSTERSNKINIEALKTGTYLIQVETAEGTFTQKVFKS